MKIKQGNWLLGVSAAVMAFGAFADPAQDIELAEKAFNDQNLPMAMELLNKAALQSYAPAQVRYAELLDYAEEDQSAVFWYSVAIEQGSLAGELGLGGMYLKGEGVKKDTEKGLYWIQHAAEQGYFPAADTLARYYRGHAQTWEEKATFLKAKADAEKASAEKAAAEKKDR